MYIKPTYTVHGSKPQLNELQVQTSKLKERNFSATLKMKWELFSNFYGQLFWISSATLWLAEMR